MIKTIKFEGTQEEIHAQWLKSRANGIGASEVCNAVGLGKYQTQFDWWRKKIAAREGKFEEFENDAILFGHTFEDGVAQLFSKKTGLSIIKSSVGDWTSHNTECEFAYASPDRTYRINGDASQRGAVANDNKGLLECKTTNDRNIIEPYNGDPNYYPITEGFNCPLTWFMQVQWQMYCTGIKHGAIAAAYLAGRKFVYSFIEYDEDFVVMQLLPELTKAWEMVVNCEPPALTSAEDAAIRYPYEIKGKHITATDEITTAINRIKEIGAIVAPLTKEEKQLKDGLKVFFEDNEAVTDAYGVPLATYKCSKSKNEINLSRVAVENPELYKELADNYTDEVQGSRRLLIKK